MARSVVSQQPDGWTAILTYNEAWETAKTEEDILFSVTVTCTRDPGADPAGYWRIRVKVEREKPYYPEKVGERLYSLDGAAFFPAEIGKEGGVV